MTASAHKAKQKPPLRWNRRKEARPAEILEAAVKVFAKKGFAATRMDDIAQAAGVTKGTIYLYFNGKEAVFKMLVRQSLGSQLARILDNVKTHEGSAKDLIRMILSAMGNFLVNSDRVVLPKIILAEAGNFPELARFYREEIIEKGLGALSQVIARGVADGEFRSLPPEHVARLCVTPLLFIAIWRTTFAAMDEQPYDYAGFVQTHIDVLLRGLSPTGEGS